MHLNKTALAIIVSLGVLTGCSSTRLDGGAPINDISKSTANPATTSPVDSRGINSVDLGASKSGPYKYAELNDPQSILAKRSVYFDFDSYTVKPEYNEILAAHARFLVSHPDQAMMIQGNTDAVGGTEYNLALGQRRAEAIRRALNTLGVQDKQLEATSLGMEKPKALGHDAASYAENRRGDMVYEIQ